ncbi:MAG: DUF5691 domain-containing protein [Saprospiraceae bacterium]
MHWNELVKLALLGTDRSTLSPAMKAELQGYGIDTDKEITEVILESAALYAPLQKAGYEPKTWEQPLLAKSPEEELANCTKQSANHLRLILLGRYPYALAEFVQGMADYQKCLPFEFLPELLDKCTKDEFLWQKIAPIIGHRGDWLIGLNPVWQKLKVDTSQEKWEIGTKVERVVILRKLRQDDPEAGLSMLLSTWAEDGLSEKAAFLKCLSIGLSDMDEVFLEECLDFPRKQIRESAAILLSELPNSQLQQRIRGYLKEAITVGKEDGIAKPFIILPSPKDQALLRDGISPKRKWKRGGETTGMLYQMVAILPPHHWEKQFQKSPSEILYFFTQSEWAMMLVEGVANAAALHGSVDWMEAILRFWLVNYNNRRWAELNIKPVLSVLPNEVFNEVLFEKLKARNALPEEHSPLIQLLQKENYVWDERLTNTLMPQLKEWIADNVSYSWTGIQYRKMLKQAGYNIAPKKEKQLSKFWMGLSQNWAGWEKDIQQFLTVLQFRREMLEELEK